MSPSCLERGFWGLYPPLADLLFLIMWVWGLEFSLALAWKTFFISQLNALHSRGKTPVSADMSGAKAAVRAWGSHRSVSGSQAENGKSCLDSEVSLLLLCSLPALKAMALRSFVFNHSPQELPTHSMHTHTHSYPHPDSRRTPFPSPLGDPAGILQLVYVSFKGSAHVPTCLLLSSL